MLITNTPNNELHVYNNSGEEIVKIDESGVVKPDGGLPTFVMNNPVFEYENNVCYYIFASCTSEEEARARADEFMKYPKIVINNADLTSMGSLDINSLSCELINALGLTTMWDGFVSIYGPAWIHAQIEAAERDEIWYVGMALTLNPLGD